MITVQLLVPTNVLERLSVRHLLSHRDGHHGYFTALTKNELWGLIHRLYESGHRVDITPGPIVKLTSRKE